MKKIISFLILFIPWLLSIFIIFLSNPINNLLRIYIILSIIFYFIFTIFLYKKIEFNNYNNNSILYLSLFYIINQSFNIILFYYNNIMLCILLGIIMIILYLLSIFFK